MPRILLTMVPFADRAAGSETLMRSNSDRVVMKTLTSNTVQIVDPTGNVQFEFRTDAFNSAGEFKMFNETGTETVDILGGGGFDGSGFVSLRRADGSLAAHMAANADFIGTSMGLWSSGGGPLVTLLGVPSGGRIALTDGAGVQRIGLDSNGDSADGVNAIYEMQFGVRHVITSVIVRTTKDDPYTHLISLDTLLEMRSHWILEHQDIRRMWSISWPDRVSLTQQWA